MTGQRSGFLLSPAVAEAWRDNGCAKELSDDGRLLRLNINILDQRYDFVWVTRLPVILGDAAITSRVLLPFVDSTTECIATLAS